MIRNEFLGRMMTCFFVIIILLTIPCELGSSCESSTPVKSDDSCNDNNCTTFLIDNELREATTQDIYNYSLYLSGNSTCGAIYKDIPESKLGGYISTNQFGYPAVRLYLAYANNKDSPRVLASQYIPSISVGNGCNNNSGGSIWINNGINNDIDNSSNVNLTNYQNCNITTSTITKSGYENCSVTNNYYNNTTIVNYYYNGSDTQSLIAIIKELVK